LCALSMTSSPHHRPTYSTEQVMEILFAGAENNNDDALRMGNLLYLPSAGDLIVVGDLHNHYTNFHRIVRAAALDKNRHRHIIFQELIHGGELGTDGEDTSLELLLEAIELQRTYPDRVHFLLANHDLAQVQRDAIAKDGHNQTESFNKYIAKNYPKDTQGIKLAFRAFSFSMPLAAMSVTGLLISHSLPQGKDLLTFDHTILQRELTEEDCERGGAAFQMVWGRMHTPSVLVTLAKLWHVEYFICGHQGAEEGFQIRPPNMLIIDSCHDKGYVLPLDLCYNYNLEVLQKALCPIARL